MQAKDRIVLALDGMSKYDIESHVDKLQDLIGVFKLCPDSLMRHGPDFIRNLAYNNKVQIFLDLKLHDISNTVENGVAAAVEMGVKYLTIHSSVGSRAMEAAVRRASNYPTQLLAITILTSFDQEIYKEVYGEHSIEMPDRIEQLASLAMASGMHGCVCSVQESGAISIKRSQTHRPEFAIVVPGVRMVGDAVNEQKRVATPSEAFQRGADIIVVGRPITNAADPRMAAENILLEITRSWERSLDG